MKIISYPIMKTECSICNCVFSFNYSDIHFKWNDFRSNYSYVTCPLCGHNITVPDSYADIKEKYKQ